MNKYLPGGILLVLIITIVVWISGKNKKNVVVLDQEMADASEKEKQRIESGNYGKSPLPDYDYSKWADEQSLTNPIENGLDSTIMTICREFRDYTDEKRSEIRNSISQDGIYTLLTFSKRATIFGIRKGQASYILDGFITVSMIDVQRCDYRDILVTLSFLNHGLQKLNMNDSEIFSNTIHLSDGNTGNLIKQFFERTPRDKSTEVLAGYKEIETFNGSSFIQTNYEKYEPVNDLAKILFDISDYIFHDKYRKGEITIGQKMTSYWLSADNEKKIEKVISNASACASLSTFLKDEFNPAKEDQMMLIFLTEFKEPNSIQVLNSQISTTIPKTFARLGFIEGNIFCLIIQRTTMQGAQDFETTKSLRRFETPLKEIIKRYYR